MEDLVLSDSWELIWDFSAIIFSIEYVYSVPWVTDKADDLTLCYVKAICFSQVCVSDDIWKLSSN
jgi:hypothetical protein